MIKNSDLVLKRQLDKEGVDGPTSFAVNIRCRRKQKNPDHLQRRPDTSLKGKIRAVLFLLVVLHLNGKPVILLPAIYNAHLCHQHFLVDET